MNVNTPQSHVARKQLTLRLWWIGLQVRLKILYNMTLFSVFVFKPSHSVFSLYSSLSFPSFSSTMSSLFSSSVSPAVRAVNFWHTTCVFVYVYVCACVCVCVSSDQNRLHLRTSQFEFTPWGNVCPSTKRNMYKALIRSTSHKQPNAPVWKNKPKRIILNYTLMQIPRR